MQTLPTKNSFPLLCALGLLHAAATFLLALTRLYSYKASLLDIGLFDQLLWNLLHKGEPLTTATLPFTPQHWLGFHFSPILALLLPIHALLPYPETLQGVQSVCFSAAAIPLFYAAQAAGAKQHEAWACAALYWLNPFLLSAAVWDFHEIALSTPLIACGLWALCSRQYTFLLITLMLLMLTKEHYGVSVAGFGVLWAWRYKDVRRGGALILTGIAVLSVILMVIMPHFSVGGTHPMLSASANVVSRYGWLSKPWEEKFNVFYAIFFGDDDNNMTGVLYILLLLISGLFLLLFAPVYMAPAAADLLANILSVNPMPRHCAAYHSAAVIPVIMIAALQGYHWLLTRVPSSRPLVQSSAIIMMMVLPLTGLTLYSVRIWELWPLRLEYDKSAVAEINAILRDDPIVAQANIGMFFSQRSAIFPFPHKLEAASFVVLHVSHPFIDTQNLLFGIPYGESSAEYIQHVQEMLASPHWSIGYWNKPWLVMKRGEATADETAQRAEIHQAIVDLGKVTARPAPQNP